jgi:hypothetical protein
LAKVKLKNERPAADGHCNFQEAVGRASNGEHRTARGAEQTSDGRTADRGHEPESVAFTHGSTDVLIQCGKQRAAPALSGIFPDRFA